jgi:diaminopropionate ammonia-lyase
VVLLFSTEGDTDPVKYRQIVWEGAYPSIEK